MQEQCIDRLACDNAEFERGNSAAADATTAATLDAGAVALAWTVLPLVIFTLLRRLQQWRKRRGGATPAAAADARASRRSAGANLRSPQASPAARQPAAQTQPPAPRAAAQPGPGSPLLKAADAMAGVLLLPISLLQTAAHMARGGRGAAPPRTPDTGGLAAAAGRGSSGRRQPTHFGLGYGEAESEEDEWGADEGESELTQAQLRRLQQSPKFQAHLQARGLTSADVASSTRKLRLLRRLRRMDPGAFSCLLSPGSCVAFESRPPSRLLLAADYLLSTALSCVAAAAAYCLAAAPLPPAAKAAAVAAALWLPLAQWRQSRPAAGALWGLWWEELEWGHAAPGWRCMAAGALELAYVLGSAGLGLLVSLGMRCASGRRQAVGELLAGVRAVQEVRLVGAQE